MSGIYIEGMEMPTKGYRLILVHADGTVQTTDGETTAAPVPEHGRLIDADALVRELNSIRASFGSANGLVEGGLNIAVSTVNGSPTIIPAEEEFNG